MKYIYTILGLSKFKKKKILSHASTWMNFEDIMVNEINQSQKDKHCVISSHELLKNNQINKNIKLNCGYRQLEREGKGQLLISAYSSCSAR